MEQYLIIGMLTVVLIFQLIFVFGKGGKDAKKETDAIRADLEVMQRSLKGDAQESARLIREEFQRNRTETNTSVNHVAESVARFQNDSIKEQREQQIRLLEMFSEQSKSINSTLTASVEKLQMSNEKKLDEMRATVDEKLTNTLTQRLDSSFKTVGDQLQNLYKSLGEMKDLASGVSDLQRVLTNVKARGTWAEVQLGSILEQTLTPSQFERNVTVKKNREMVEYAIKIPSREEDGKHVWLPIDSKFPQEDYIRLCEAAERADKDAVEKAAHALENAIKTAAAKISNLYIDVPATTDFAILFLPTEGLYAEVLRRPGLAEDIQTKNRVMICGPTTITAFLNTLQIGFKTIAIDKKAAEVWRILGAAKQQYAQFEKILDKAKKKIDEAGSVLEDAQKRNGIIIKKLGSVDGIDDEEAGRLLDSTF